MDGATGEVAIHDPGVGSTSLEKLPKELGLLLIVAGVGGILLPGPVGTPFLVLGGLVLFPKVFQKLDRGLERKFPRIHREGRKQVDRFLVDLERRYPGSV